MLIFFSVYGSSLIGLPSHRQFFVCRLVTYVHRDVAATLFMMTFAAIFVHRDVAAILFMMTFAAIYVHRDVEATLFIVTCGAIFSTNHEIGNFLVSFLAARLGGRSCFGYICHHCMGCVSDSTILTLTQ